MSAALVYLLGYPGAGKTTLMRELVGELGQPTPALAPFAHVFYNPPSQVVPYAVQLGRDRGPMSGTDALSMSVNPLACAFIDRALYPLVLAEGDRLANARFFDAATTAGYALRLYLLRTTPEEARQRAEARGSHQDPRWTRGRHSKIDNLAARYADHVFSLNATQSPHALAELIREREPLLR